MKFTFELELDDTNHTAGYIVGMMEALSEGIQEHYEADTDMRKKRILIESGELIVCEAGLNEAKTECNARMVLSTEPFDRPLRSMLQVEKYDGHAYSETRNIKTYTENPDAVSDPS